MMQKKNHFSKKTPFFFLIFAGLFGFSLRRVNPQTKVKFPSEDQILN
jgi:hypothetical protein